MKHVKMILYGNPATGKSVFASKFPKPYFICTDGNYEYLEDFGADMNAYTQVHSWEETKKLFSKPETFNDYETIVIDLVEDLFKWCEYEYCKRKGLDHIGDEGFGKGYDFTRNEFFINICKIIDLNKNVILISHGVDEVKKDKRGVEHTYHRPSARVPDKVWDMLEGRIRFFLRCYLKGVNTEDKYIQTRMLSLTPKVDEYSIIRGVNVDTFPEEIELDANKFLNVIGMTSNKVENKSIEPKKTETNINTKEIKEEPKKVVIEVPKVEEKPIAKVEPTPKVETKEKIDVNSKIEEIKRKLAEKKNGGNK